MAQRQLDLLGAGAKEPVADGGGKGRKRGGGKGGSGGDGGSGDGGGGPTPPADASLADEAQRRYLNYAVSVITARALPDVRDGLKPVQRRILYAMHSNLHLYPDSKFRKCATIVGEVLGKYHPHGDASSYEAMVRMAQWFSLRYTLVEGHGNFGSLDGDAPAAYRYTEARLAPLAMELLDEIKQGTVDFRPNYDGTTEEPIVLPAKVPQLLVNGCTGIAVGMATNIPSHNLEEVCQAAIALIDDRELQTKDLLKYIKGPDFPTGGQITNSKKELREIYETGQGGVRLRGEWKIERAKAKEKGGERIVITSIAFGVSKATLVERIAEVIINKKLPMLVDVRDESTDDVRIVLELKSGADPALVMSYLYKHTPLEQSFHVNLTCLVPTENKEIAGPLRLDLAAMLREFLEFRAGGRHPALPVRAGGARAAHPHPGGLRDHLRCPRRDHQDHPRVRRQGRRRRQDDQALRARRRADRRDPGAEAVQAGQAGDPADRRRAQGQARRAPRRSAPSSGTSASCGR